MDIKRSSTPPLPGHADQQQLRPPLTPCAPLPKTVIPPSPEGPRLELLAVSSKRAAKLRAPPPCSKRSQTAGVQKKSKAIKTMTNIVKNIGIVAGGRKPIGFMDLPGEIRNMIYSYTAGNARQALLVHRPRLASLRPRTRLDRNRTLRSDVLDEEQRRALAGGTSGKTALLARDTNRPFVGLTQVCRLLREEFRPMYLQKQEIGMDLVDVQSYLSTFYPKAAEHLKVLSTSKDRKMDMPYTGNMTIAVGHKTKEIERSAVGIDVWPLLDVWANSFKIEAGFGRYMQAHYDATADGEAKDLYRLFGRRVHDNRKCSLMNARWRNLLRTRAIATVEIHRHPAGWSQGFRTPVPQTAFMVAWQATVGKPRPYIHITFKSEHAESWMTQRESQIPPNWLSDHGFGTMEYFEVKVGVATSSGR